MHLHIRAQLACLDGYGIGFKPIVDGLNRGTALVDDFDAEGTVIIAGNRRDNGDADVLHILLYGIDPGGVGKHNIFGIIVGSVVLPAG